MGERVSDRVSTLLPKPVKRAVKRTAEAYGETTSGWRMMPSYLLIGAARCGTTSMYRYLVEHPGIGPVLTKEVQYYSIHYKNGPSWYRGHFPTWVYKTYCERRTGLPLITGEASPYYMYHPLAMERIKQDLPDIKMIVMLRDPVERAFSQYQHEVALGIENLSFEEAIEREPERLAGEEERIRADPTYPGFRYQHFSYVDRGRYAEQLERCFELFPRENFLVIRSEEFFADPDSSFNEVLAFLGLPQYSLTNYEKHNVSKRSKIAPATRAKLTDYFAEHNERLYRLLDRDFAWAA